MSVKIRHRINDHNLQAFLRSPAGGIAKNMFKRAVRIRSAAQRNLGRSPRRIRTGYLRASLYIKPVVIDGYPGFRIGSPLNYARFVHDGTGIYGPKGQPIRPKNSKWLVFIPSGGSGKVFAKEVKGMPPNPFLKDAVKAAKD